ncbi:hypothetical protein V1520DRAFT_333583 [Lipomyces starkeyi]
MSLSFIPSFYCWRKHFSTLNPESGTIAEKSYPSLSYNFGTETVTVVAVPSNVHEAGVYWINHEINTYAENYLSTHSPRSMDSILPLGSIMMRGFYGPFAKCVKQLDGGVRHKTRQDDIVTVERYKKLCRDKDIWIDGLGVKVFILFKMPSTEYEHIEDPEAEVILMKECMAGTLESNLLLNRIAPFVYRRHKWGGQLRTAFIEVWRPDSIPIRCVNTCDHLPTTLGLHTSDLFPDDAREATDIPDRDIPFDAHRYLKTLIVAINGNAKDKFKSKTKRKSKSKSKSETRGLPTRLRSHVGE